MTSDALVPPLTASAWMAMQESCSPDSARQLHGHLVAQFADLVAGLAHNVCDRWSADDTGNVAYSQRVWSCFEHHWRRLAGGTLLTFKEMERRFEDGDLGFHVGQANLLREVMLAQALELKQSKAATMFDKDYMPDVWRIAHRYGGERAAESVENLTADLILPRRGARGEDLPPRIASYQGRTSLRSWLRAVVVHRWASAMRKASPYSLPENLVLADQRATPTPGSGECEELLRPIFAGAVGALDPEDRVMIKMLVLDDVPQAALAQSLGIHSGNVTRRRQRAMQQILAHVVDSGRSCSTRRQFDECMDEILAGNDRSLQQTLGGALAAALEHGTKPLGQEP